MGKRFWVIVGVVALLVIGFAAAYVWQARKALQKAVDNRQLLGGAVGVVEDAGSLWSGLQSVYKNLNK